MIHDLAGGENIPSQVLDQIVQKTDGVPLFIEELTTSILERAVANARHFRARRPARIVQGSTAQRCIDGTARPAPRPIAQVAAVIGREFSCDLLSAVAQINESELQSALLLLEEADIIYRVGITPSIRFVFKHALLRDAIYDSLLRSRKQQIHSDIAAILESDYPELVESQPEVLAYHHQEAGNHQRAIRCWLDSGQRALAHSPMLKRLRVFEKPFSF